MAQDETDGLVGRLGSNVYALWGILALPGLFLIVARIADGKIAYVYYTGVISSILLIVSLMVTPMMQLVGPLPWLKARRRYFGVASFLYAVLHTLFWLVNANWGKLIASFFRVELLTGWIALAIMVPLAATSFNRAVRYLGRNWKSLQRWVYLAAVLTLVHWLMTGDRVEAVLWSLPLVVLTGFRLVRRQRQLARR